MKKATTHKRDTVVSLGNIKVVFLFNGQTVHTVSRSSKF